MSKEKELEKQYEKLLNIKTSGWDYSTMFAHHHPYEPTPYVVLERLAKSEYVTKNNTLLDYGCGKGRVGFYMAYQTRCKVIGIEYSDRIYETALANKDSAVSGDKVDFIHVDATEYDVPDSVDRVFFFNPFAVQILENVISRLIESLYERPREMMLFFYFPSDEYISFLMTKDELEFVDEIECDDLFDKDKESERILCFKLVV